MNGKNQNCLEFFDEIKDEWCRSEEQHKPFWNDVLTFARMYHKMMKTESSQDYESPVSHFISSDFKSAKNAYNEQFTVGETVSHEGNLAHKAVITSFEVNKDSNFVVAHTTRGVAVVDYLVKLPAFLPDGTFIGTD